MDYWNITTAISVLAALLLFLLWLSKRVQSGFGMGRSNRCLQVVDRLPVGEKRAILLVRVRDREILIGSTPASISTLFELDELPAPAASAQEGESRSPEADCPPSGKQHGWSRPAASWNSRGRVNLSSPFSFRKLFDRLLVSSDGNRDPGVSISPE